MKDSDPQNLNDSAEFIKQELRKNIDINVSIAIYGPPGAGKSSLINALLGVDDAQVSQRVDTTIEEGIYESKDPNHNLSGITFSDLPGYGTEKFPEYNYFDKFPLDKYDLILFVTNRKIEQNEIKFINELIKKDKKYIVIRNYHDAIKQKGRTIEDLEKEIYENFKSVLNLTYIDLVFTSCITDYGVGSLSEKIAKGLNGAKRDKWYRTAKAYTKDFLDKKKAACKKLVTYSAGLSAANGLNPIPGLGIAIDSGILIGLFIQIRKDFGLDEKVIGSIEKLTPSIAPVVNQIIKFATKEGIIVLLKKFAGRTAVKEISKYIPFVGQAIASSIGFATTKYAGNEYVDLCYEAAEVHLNSHIKL